MDWFETWFDTPYYHILYQNHDTQEAENFLTKLLNVLSLPQQSKIIDLACGKGRHSVFLNKMGYDVLGLDLSKKSIEYDRQFENDSLKFREHDMRNPIPEKQIDAVLNLFTSFGYFDSETEDRKVFHSVFDALKPEGFFVLDYLNQRFVREHLIEHSTVVKDGYIFKIHKKIEDNFIIKTINFTTEKQDFQFYEKVKLHTPEKILAYAEEAGFKRVNVWGDYQLNDFDELHSPRCINLFQK